MFNKFGEFDSADEMNRAAAAQRKEGDNEAILAIAEENGIDKEDAIDFIDGCVAAFVTPLMVVSAGMRKPVFPGGGLRKPGRTGRDRYPAGLYRNHPVKGAVPPGAGWPCHDVYGQSSAPGVGNEHAVLQRQKG